MRAIELFSGCGGLSLGFINAGIEVISAYEIWEPACQIYSANFNHPVHKFDLSNYAEAISHISQYSPDMIFGGPPCQDFSSAGKRNEKGGRADLTISFGKIVCGINPKWFVMENVDRAAKSKAFAKTKKMLVECGYGLTQMVIDASLVGVPQKRKRVFLIGKKKAKDGFLEKELLDNLSDKPMTVSEYFGDNIAYEFYYRHPRSYARRAIFSIHEPSATIRGVNRPVPPEYKVHKTDAAKSLKGIRSLTPFERAQIQTFPPSFKWDGVTKSTLELIIGNAVPVKLAEYVAKAVNKFDNQTVRRPKLAAAT